MIFAQFASKIFTQSMESVATVPLFAGTFNKEVSNVLCEKPIILVELLLELRIVVKIVKMAKGLFAKYALGTDSEGICLQTLFLLLKC